MRKLKKDDEVMVITGKEKGRRGVITQVLGDRVIVQNLNIAKKHRRPNPQQNVPGGIVEQEMPIHISNVMLFNPVTEKADRVGIKALEDGRRVRYFKSNKEVVDT